MTHQPPLPDAAVSPYPLHPAPHDEGEGPAFFTENTRDDEDDGASRYALADRLSLPDSLSLNVIGLGAAIGLGVAAIAGALLYGRGGASRRPASRGGSRAKRGTAGRARARGGQPYEAGYFARKHRITAAEARAIIAEAGPDRDKANALVKRKR